MRKFEAVEKMDENNKHVITSLIDAYIKKQQIEGVMSRWGDKTMQLLSIPYSDDLLVSTGKSKEALEQELRFLLAVKLFELRRLSLGKAAQLCGMPKLNFMNEIGRMGIPVINLDDDQIQDELQNA